ncbi:hypothetical protein AB1Y20_016697 [Prymnesium parvum]|uniref:CRC domain-containing protein n=1 Tax=Prymnesium parvum TaxID=97485 RepID=A0AB34IDJ9_PRYPA|mmetsp:Transcript_32058/g.79866  ORF Transcript_32058/g.79866 Transcript_32058/m.79866 type:complete len:334 (+) Transcript_32058:34-1035(+)|eukprot:CAMPEP_0182803434 /NCGR_PEP_ID=MMETSP0006_2-20121128/4028_1 /TAXON_ID=97485 /ORGANISM="Prymnesium parvum, Strain Texoma1" /LENGTH=333 /DNA_ID=CAMNT_0024928911 /DNA_START=45 /DNA_END=1046 /DNA_ORIENTATION=+
MAFVPVGPANRGSRRERFCHLVTIWVLLAWNLCLQLRSAAGQTCGSRTYSSSQYTLAFDAQANPFVDPSVATATSVTNFTVCSGCTLSADGSVVSDGVKERPDNNSSAREADLPALASDPVALPPSPPTITSASPFTSSGSLAPSPAPSIVFTSPSVSPPISSPASWWAVASNLSALNTSVLNGSAATVSLPSATPMVKLVVPDATRPEGRAAALAPIPAALPKGAECASSFKGDSRSADCLGFCQAKYARSHCGRCKCKACDFCPRREAAKMEARNSSRGVPLHTSESTEQPLANRSRSVPPNSSAFMAEAAAASARLGNRSGVNATAGVTS